MTTISACGSGTSSTNLSSDLDSSGDIGASPKIVRTAIESPKNIYGLDDNIRISVTFDQKVFVQSKGVPFLRLFLHLRSFLGTHSMIQEQEQIPYFFNIKLQMKMELKM